MNEVNQEKKETLEKESFQNINTAAENILPTEKGQESQTMGDTSGESQSLQSNEISSEILVVPSFPEVSNQSYDSSSSSNVDSFNTNNNESLSTSTVMNNRISSSIDQTKDLSTTFPSELTQPTSSVVNESSSFAANQSSSSAANQSPSSAVNQSPSSAVNQSPNSATNQSPNSATNQTISSAGPAVIPIPMVDSNHDTTVSSQMNTASSSSSSNGNNFQPPIENYNENKKIDDYSLLGDFVGPNFEKFSYRKFNFSAFFFTYIYFFYRKMYFYPFVISLIDDVLKYFLHISDDRTVYSIIYSLIFSIIIGILFNPLYMHFAKKKVRKIKRKNFDKNFEELRYICSRKGGRSIASIFVGFAILLVIYLGIYFLQFLFEFSVFITALYVILSFFHISNALNPTYDGMLSYDSSIIIDEKFSIDVPNLFENYSDLSRYYYSYESGEGFFNNCSFRLSKVSNFYDAENLIQQMSQYSDRDDDIVSSDSYHEKINNLDWYWFSSNSYYGTTYYYATSKNSELYLLQYEVGEDTDSACDSYRESILNSIKEK